ncbi:unnamed protein product [Cunninghamella blakesleeana]
MQIRQLVLDYISKPNSIILAVTPANTDLANSDSLKLARQVDPSGKRTVGVITKLDLMDAGTNALDVLTGRVFPLKLGFVGVVNRSQQDILTNKSMNEALKAEQRFFQRHPAYKSIANQCGTPYLAKQLNNILVAHIRERLPDLRSRLSTLIGQTQHELEQFGDPAFSGKLNRGPLILKLLTMFATEFVSSIDGTSAQISTKELCGGARIYYIFNNVFGQALNSIAPCSNLTDDDIRIAIRNSTGPRCSLFVPELAFDLLVRPQIKLLEAPSLRCVELAFEELSKICYSCGNKELQRFPKLHAKLIEVVSDLLNERLSPTTNYVQSLIDIECAYINTNHPDFLGATGAMQKKSNEVTTPPSSKPNSRRRHNSSHLQVAAINNNMSHSRRTSITSTITNASASSPPKEAFLSYFFGGGNQKSERSILPSSYSHQPSSQTISSTIEHEVEQYISNNPSAIEKTNIDTNHIKEDLEIELIRKLITSYFNIVKKSIQDLVPKSIMHLLVNFSKGSVQNRLVSTVYVEDLFDDLLQEDVIIASERQRCKQLLEVYRKAFIIINDVM